MVWLFRDTAQRFGVISKFLHWAIAGLIILQYCIIFWKRNMLPENSPLADFLIGGLHKPIGVVLLTLGIAAIVWRLVNPKPDFPAGMVLWQQIIAKLTHLLLYLGLLVMTLSGITMTMTAGYDINIFNLYTVTPFFAKNKELSKLLFNIHEVTSIILLGLIGLHFLAALKHHFIDKDNVLVRMLPFGKVR